MYSLVFLYFVTLSAELLNLPLFLFKIKVTHVVSLLLLAVLWRSRIRFVCDSRLLKIFGAILASMVVSAVLGAHPARSLGYVGVYLLSFVFYFLIPFTLMQGKDGEKVFRLYLASFVCVGLYALIQVVLPVFGVYEPLAVQRVGGFVRAQGWNYEPSYYALYLMPFVMYHNAKAVIERSFSWKVAVANLFLLVSTSTSCLFAYLFFALVVSFWVSWKRGLKFLGAAAMGLALGVFMLRDLIAGSFFKFFYAGWHHHSFTERWQGIKEGWEVFLDHPFFGVGVGGVGPYLQQKFYGAGEVGAELATVEKWDPTNVTVEVLSSLGVVGFACFGALFWRMVKMYREGGEEGKPFFIALIVTLFILQFNQGLFRPYIWVSVSMTLAHFSSIRKIPLSLEKEEASPKLIQ